MTNGIARVQDVLPRLSLLAQGGTAVGTVHLRFPMTFVPCSNFLIGLEHESRI